MQLYLIQMYVYKRGTNEEPDMFVSAWADIVFAPDDHIAVVDITSRMRAAMVMTGTDPAQYKLLPAFVSKVSEALITAAYTMLIHKAISHIEANRVVIEARDDLKGCPICGERHHYNSCPELIEAAKPMEPPTPNDHELGGSKVPPAPFKDFFKSLGGMPDDKGPMSKEDDETDRAS